MPSAGLWRKIRNYVLQFLLKILGMRRVSAKFIPHILAAERREREWVREREGGRTPCTFAQTFCESWTRRSRAQQRSSRWKSESSSWLKNGSGQDRSNVKTIFYRFIRMLLWIRTSKKSRFTPDRFMACEGSTADIWPEVWRLRGRLLRQDNAPVHTVLSRLEGSREKRNSIGSSQPTTLICLQHTVSCFRNLKKKTFIWIDKKRGKGRGGGEKSV